MGPETRGGPLTVRRHRSADHLFCILSIMTGCQTASAKKRLSKVQIGMLRDDGSDSYDSYWCYGGTDCLPSVGSSDKGEGEVGGTSPLEFGVLVLLSPQSRT